MDISLDENVDTSNAIKGNLDILIVAPITHLGHVSAAGDILLVSCESK